MADPETPETRDEAQRRELQRDPIFLLQFRRWALTDTPYGYVRDDEGDLVDEDDPSVVLTCDEALELECAVAWWETDRVFLSREASDAYGAARAYNYPDGWRTFCVSAMGALADLLHEQGEAAWAADRASRAEAARVDAAHPEVARGR